MKKPASKTSIWHWSQTPSLQETLLDTPFIHTLMLSIPGEEVPVEAQVQINQPNGINGAIINLMRMETLN